MLQLSPSEVLTLAGRAARDPRTVKRAYAGDSVTPLSHDSIARSAAELGLPAPPPPRRRAA